MDPAQIACARLVVADPRGRHHLGQHDARREDVRARVERLAARLLRRHVRRRPRHRAARPRRARLGDAEVHHHHAPRPGEHHVLGLDVAVDEPRGVDRLEAGQELRGDLARLVEPQRTARGQDLGAASRRRRTPSTPARGPSSSTRSKTRQTFGETTSRAARTSWRRRLERSLLPRGSRRPQRLERHVHPQLEVEGPPDLAHAAAAEQRADAVPAAEDLPAANAPAGWSSVSGLCRGLTTAPAGRGVAEPQARQTRKAQTSSPGSCESGAAQSRTPRLVATLCRHARAANGTACEGHRRQ